MSEKIEKKTKKKGPIRLEAIIPVAIIFIITFIYFSFYFDRHLKNLVEYAGTQANGAEVNVGSINTSFLRGSFDLNKLEVTDKEKPQLNSIEIGNIHFEYLWDALLRMKFVVQEASINNVQLYKPRKSPGHVLPPEPAKPSKINEIQDQVIAQIKNKYSANMLGDAISLLGGTDYKDQLENIRAELKSESRIKAITDEVQTKKEYWDNRIKQLSDTSRLKAIEAEVQAISKEKNFLKQAEGVKKLSDSLKFIEGQYKDIQDASKKLKSEVTAFTQYPKEIERLVKEDIASLKNRLSIPEVDFKDMAMHLFSGQFSQYIAKARKYQALSKQYIPEKKEQEEVIPPKRSEGKTYLFPITTSYPLFWLKRAAISSEGTADSYSGKVSGELTNVTTDPKHIQLPMKLDVNGDFPAVKVQGARALITVDHTRKVPKQSALIQVNSFGVPEQLFVSDEKLKFGFLNAIGAATFKAEMSEGKIRMNWLSSLTKPQFLVETKNKVAKEMLSNILNTINTINIDGSASGSFSNLKMDINSNLGDELAVGFKREIGAKVAEAEQKLHSLVEEKINKPRAELESKLKGSQQNIADLGNLQQLYKKHEDQIKKEIDKLKKGGGSNNLKEQGKKLLKGLKL